jgi:queuine tRNA-ribosyltransferase
MSDSPPDAACGCMVCRSYSRGYLHHLFRAGEMLGPQLATIHNVSYYLALMRGAREAIMAGRYPEFHALQAAGWRGENS